MIYQMQNRADFLKMFGEVVNTFPLYFLKEDIVLYYRDKYVPVNGFRSGFTLCRNDE